MSTPEISERMERPSPLEAARPRRSLSEIGTPAMMLMQVALGVAFLVAWQLIAGRVIDEFMISSPLAVAQRLWGWFADGSIFVHIWATLYATLIGFFIGATAGIVGGIWLGLSPFLSRLLNPFIWAFNALPKSRSRRCSFCGSV